MKQEHDYSGALEALDALKNGNNDAHDALNSLCFLVEHYETIRAALEAAEGK